MILKALTLSLVSQGAAQRSSLVGRTLRDAPNNGFKISCATRSPLEQLKLGSWERGGGRFVIWEMAGKWF